MEIENLYKPNPWISVREIRNAADLKKSLKSCIHRKAASSPPETPSRMLSKTNDSKTNSIFSSFNMHTYNNTGSIDSMHPSLQMDLENINEKKFKIHLYVPRTILQRPFYRVH